MDSLRKKQKLQNKLRFVLYSDTEIASKHEASKNKNTTNSENRANSAFQKFLAQAGKTDLEYWFYDE